MIFLSDRPTQYQETHSIVNEEKKGGWPNRQRSKIWTDYRQSDWILTDNRQVDTPPHPIQTLLNIHVIKKYTIGSKLSTILKVTELSYPCNVAATVFAGGCPYPGIEGDQIANKLKDGYRMPKPKHIDQKLWLECLSYSVKNISFVKEMIFRRIDKHVKFIKNCGLWHFLIRCRNVTLPIYLLCSFLILMCLKIILQKTMHRVSI